MKNGWFYIYFTFWLALLALARIMKNLGHFCETTSFHGFKEFHDSPKLGLKLFWLVLIIASLTITCYEVYMVCTDFIDTPTGTSIKCETYEAYKLPQFVFCPSEWVDETKVKNLPISKDALNYASSLLFQLEPNSTLNKSVRESSEEFFAYVNSTNKTMMDFYLDIAKDHSEFLQYTPLNLLRVNVDGQPAGPQYRIQYAGLTFFCYVLSFTDIHHNSMGFIGFQFRTGIKNRKISNDTDGNQSRFFQINKRAPYVVGFITTEEKVVFQFNNIAFKPNTTYKMDLQASYRKRMSSDGKPCASTSEMEPKRPYSKMSCEVNCFCEKWVEMGLLPCYVFGMSWKSQKGPADLYPPCSNYEIQYDMEAARLMAKMNASIEGFCRAECLEECEKWHFDYTMYTEFGQLEDYFSALEVFYNPSKGIMYFEEFPTYTWDTLLSNIGGHFGLWMGGSVISVIQIGYFLILICFQKKISMKVTSNVSGKSFAQLS